MSGPGLMDPTPEITGINPRSVLLLQGPMGPFFGRLRKQLLRQGAKVKKVNFNSGDDLFDRGDHVVHFRGTREQWPAFFTDLVHREKVDTVFLFGDGRPMHRAVAELARELDFRLFVFEEGYLRPTMITIEEGGVNGNSLMPRDPDVYRRRPPDANPNSDPQPPLPQLKHTFFLQACCATLYSLRVTYMGGGYPHYQHHRSVDSPEQARAWLRSAYRKLKYAYLETGKLDELARKSGQYYFVPLQVFCDYQLKHSDFNDMQEFIEVVMTSFARSAPENTDLVFKHHPMDRAYSDYASHISELSTELGVQSRVHYVHDLHLPTLLNHAKACITINSTVGLQALHHRLPTKTLGKAVYDLPGLTSQQDLDTFLQHPEEVDEELYRGFRSWMLRHCQARGSFYRRLPGVKTPTGVLWPRRLNQYTELEDAAPSAKPTAGR